MSFQRTWRQRLPLLALIILLQMLYFPLNQKSSTGVRFDLPVIDGVMPLISEFVVIYIAGIVFFSFGSLLMTLILPHHLFQAYVLTHITVMLTGFLLWIIIPAYVYKAPFAPENQFDVWTQELHLRDVDYGNQNAFPSSHVYYITVLLFFISKRWPRTWFICALLSVLNAWSTMLTRQHYFLDVVVGLLLTYGGIWLTYRVYLPKLAEWEKDKEILMPPQGGKLDAIMTTIGYPSLISEFLGWDITTFDSKTNEDDTQRIEH